MVTDFRTKAQHCWEDQKDPTRCEHTGVEDGDRRPVRAGTRGTEAEREVEALRQQREDGGRCDGGVTEEREKAKRRRKKEVGVEVKVKIRIKDEERRIFKVTR